MSFDFGANNKRSNSFGFDAAPASSTTGFGAPNAFGTGATPATPAGQSFGFGAAATPAQAPATQSFGFGTPAAGTAQTANANTPSFGFGGASTSTPAASTGFSFGAAPAAQSSPSAFGGFGSASTTTTSSTGGAFGTLTGQSSLSAPNQFFSQSVPAQTSTGIPYPKETKFSDLPDEVQKAIQSLETTIRNYEATSFQVANRRYEKIEACASLTADLENKIQVFEFAITQNQNRMIAAKRNLGKYWKYGENVSRQISSMKPQVAAVPGTAVPATPSIPTEQLGTLISASDFKFLEAIIYDFQHRASELEVVANNIKSLLEHLQAQPKFSIQSLRNTIKAHSDSLLSLAEKLAVFHDEIQVLRNVYRQFCLIYRHDSRDPFAPKYTSVPAPPQTLAQPQQQGIVAPMLNSIMGKPQPTSFFPSTPATPAFQFPTANSFMKKP